MADLCTGSAYSPLTSILSGALRLLAVGNVFKVDTNFSALQTKGFVRSELGNATPERGGRAKRYFRVTPTGLREVRETEATINKPLERASRIARRNGMRYFIRFATWLFERLRIDIGLIGDLSEERENGRSAIGAAEKC